MWRRDGCGFVVGGARRSGPGFGLKKAGGRVMQPGGRGRVGVGLDSDARLEVCPVGVRARFCLRVRGPQAAGFLGQRWITV